MAIRNFFLAGKQTLSHNVIFMAAMRETIPIPHTLVSLATNSSLDYLWTSFDFDFIQTVMSSAGHRAEKL